MQTAAVLLSAGIVAGLYSCENDQNFTPPIAPRIAAGERPAQGLPEHFFDSHTRTPVQEERASSLSHFVLAVVHDDDAKPKEPLSDYRKDVSDGLAIMHSYMGAPADTKLDIVTIVAKPQGHIVTSMRGGAFAEPEPCYSSDDIESIIHKVANQPQLRKLDNFQTGLAFDAVHTCDQGYGALSLNDEGVTLYQPEQLIPTFVAHELGHQMGLHHSAELQPKHTDPGTAMKEGKDLVSVANSSNYGVKTTRGVPDVYSDTLTVMGSHKVTDAGELFSFYEQYVLNPSLALIAEITPEDHPQTVDLSHDEGEVRGIALRLPENHPLRSIDPTASYITVGLMRGWKSMTLDSQDRIITQEAYYLQAYVVAADQNYHMRLSRESYVLLPVEGDSGEPDTSDVQTKPTRIFRDSSIGVDIYAMANQKLKTITLEVRPYKLATKLP